jgi:hypothetical protein
MTFEKASDLVSLTNPLFADLGPTTENQTSIVVTSVKDLVDQVLAATLPIKVMVDKLVIYGHGKPGCQGVGDGESTDKTGKKNLSTWLAMQNEIPAGKENTLVGDSEAEMARLIPVLKQDAVITLLGCNVAQGITGKKLLMILSRALKGRHVQAADAMQGSWFPGVEGNVYRSNGDRYWLETSQSWWGVPS